MVCVGEGATRGICFHVSIHHSHRNTCRVVRLVNPVNDINTYICKVNVGSPLLCALACNTFERCSVFVGGVRLGVRAVVLAACVGVGGVVLCRCVCVTC